MKKTLFDKVWDKHVVQQIDQGPDVLFIDRHMVHEVTSPVAFLGLKNRNIKVMYPERTFATADHNTPTINQHLPVQDPLSAKQLDALEKMPPNTVFRSGDWDTKKTESCMWLDPNTGLLSQEPPLFVETPILLLMVLLAPLHLGLGLLR